jgi:hypothetical protein
MSVPRNPVSFTAKTHAPPNSNGHGPTRSTRSLRLNFPLFFDFFVPHHAFLVGTHMQTGFAVTPSKQTTVILSSRYKKSPPGGVACWLLTIRRGSGSPASPPRRTRRGATTPTLDPSLATSSVESNRHTPQLEPIVTHSKQTTVVLSNRHKSPPPVADTTLQPSRSACPSSTAHTRVCGPANLHPLRCHSISAANLNPPHFHGFPAPRCPPCRGTPPATVQIGMFTQTALCCLHVRFFIAPAGAPLAC